MAVNKEVLWIAATQKHIHFQFLPDSRSCDKGDGGKMLSLNKGTLNNWY